MSFQNVRALLVDDFDLGRARLRTGLLEMGFADENLVEAENGQRAFELLLAAVKNAKPFDYVLSDWTMPVMTGLELLKACRNDEVVKHIKFIMVSSESDRDSILLALENGADDYLTKPVANTELSQKVKALHARAK